MVVSNKRAQGLSLNIIVVAAIVLVVLIVLVIIFGSKMNLFGNKYDSSKNTVEKKLCAVDGGVCVSKDAYNCNDIRGGSVDWIDCSNSQKCCKKTDVDQEKEAANMPVP